MKPQAYDHFHAAEHERFRQPPQNLLSDTKMALCKRCQAFDIQAFVTAPFQTLGFPLKSIEDSAENTDCAFCNFLYRLSQRVREYRITMKPQELAKRGLLHDPWIHLRLCENDQMGPAKGKRPKDVLRVNTMHVFFGPRHFYNTSMSRSEMSTFGSPVPCLLLADQGTLDPNLALLVSSP